ncbi:hypothetical protein CR513_25593, partial [Mucuna pruriens]
MAKCRLRNECLERQKRQGLLALTEERRKTADLDQQVDAAIQEFKEQAAKYLEMADHVEKAAREAREKAQFWKDRKAKQSTSQDKYATRLRMKAMERKVEVLEQQNQDLKGKVGHLKEQMA